jgi:hypothetical protein
MSLLRFELDSEGRVYCPGDPGRITHNDPWPTHNGSYTFAEPAQGFVVHTEVGYEHSVVSEFNDTAAQASAFFSVGMDGHVHQYGPIGRGWKAWTQAAGNPHWRGAEHEDKGNPNNPMTQAQLESSAALIEVTSHHDGFPLQATDDAIHGRGVIFHSDGGTAWGGHDCPGAVRRTQRPALLVIAHQLRETRVTHVNPAPAPKPIPKPVPKPAPTPTPTPKDYDMAVLLRAADKPDVFISNGVTKRHVVSQQELKEDIAAGLCTDVVHIVSQATLDAQPTVTA